MLVGRYTQSLGFFVALCFLLVSCGGGGSDSPPPPPPPPPPPANSAPTASFTASTNSLEVTVDASASTDSDGSISSYSWAFGDGNEASGRSSSNRYASVGSYTITLTVTDDDGATNSTTQTIELNELLANITVSIDKETDTIGAIILDGSGSEVRGSGNNAPTIDSYAWDFGDGNTGSGEVVKHSYGETGNFSATLTITDSTGATASTSVPTSFSLSGQITPAANSAVDVDVNDPSRQNRNRFPASFATNNSANEAQRLVNPSLVNGFVSASGSGSPSGSTSNFENDADERDIYIATLLAGQFVSLRVADFLTNEPTRNDIDLFLFDSDGSLVGRSESITALESIGVPADGDYFIEARGFNGVSKYTLNIGNSSFVSGASAYGSPVNIVPGEAVVKMKSRQTLSGLSQSKTASITKSLSHSDHSRSALAKLQMQAMPKFKANDNSIRAKTLRQNWSVLETLKQIKTLNQQADIEYAEPNYRLKPLLTPNDNFYPLQWHYPQINLPQAWNITTGSADVIVAVVDSGVVLNHPDLANKLVPGFDFIRDTDTSADGDGIDSNPDDPGDGGGSLPSSFHGTHVAGTIAANTNNNLGVAGVGWNTRVMPIRALGVDGGSSFDVEQGIRFAAGLANDSGTLPAQRADIINLSLGGGGFSQASQDLYNQLFDAGIIVVAAAGNENSPLPEYPASYDNVVSVSAANINNEKAPYSNFNSRVDVAAPGGDLRKDSNGDGYNDGVLSTLLDEANNSANYAFYEGTSMAAPHVAGVAALMKAVHPAMTASDFVSSLQSGFLTDDIGPSGRDNDFGYGLINALKAVTRAEALANGSSSGSVFASATNLEFGTSLASRTVTLRQLGSTPPKVITVEEDIPWLELNSSGANSDGIGDYVLTINRDGLSDAIYRGTVTFTLDNGPQIVVSVSMQVQSTVAAGADTGFLFILLLDADTREFVAQDDIDLLGDVYLYRFEGVPPGDYVIVGGSDVDNDTFVCGTGESCGSYPTNDQLQRIEVTGSQTQLDFVSSIVTNVINSANNTSPRSTSYQRMPLDDKEAEANKQLAK